MRRRRKRSRCVRWMAGAVWLVVVGAPSSQWLVRRAASSEPACVGAGRGSAASVSSARPESLAAVLSPGALEPIAPRPSKARAALLAPLLIVAEADAEPVPADPAETDGPPAGAEATGPQRTHERGGRRVVFTVTAYCPCRRCCGKWAGDGMTASGLPITYNDGRFVAADTSVLPFLTRVRVPGYADGDSVPVIDRGGKVRGQRVDVYFPTHRQAQRWGKKRLLIEILD